MAVHTGSSSMYGNDSSTDYGAAKAGVLGFILNLAIEAKGTGINVNCVLPGATPASRQQDEPRR